MFYQDLLAQNNSGIIKILEELNIATDNEDEATANREILEYFQTLLENPININSANRNQLREMMLLSDFQIESIIEYRTNSGDILSISELSLLNGFDSKFAELIRPFVSFAPIPASNKSDSQLYLKVARTIEKDTSVVGSQYYMRVRSALNIGNHLKFGLTMENDIGERFFKSGAPFIDFISLYLSINNYKKFNTIIIGDYSARFGQGLAMWNSFSLQTGGDPMMLYKRGSKLLPHSSAEENKFYRGIAASFSVGKAEITALLSHNKLDAAIKDGKYTSLPSGGLHNTASTIATRKTMAENVAGVNLSYLFNRTKLEISAIAYGYNKKNGRRLADYNKYQLYDGYWGNCSLSFYTVLGRIKLFGEGAMDYGASYAALLGGVAPLAENLEIGVLLRSYSKSYIAPHASAYSSLSSVSNQSGATITAVYTITHGLRMYFNGEFSYYPWKRYTINSSSYMYKGEIRTEYFGKKWDCTLRISDKFTSHNEQNRIFVKASAGYNLSPRLYIKCETAAAGGWMVASDMKYTSGKGKLKVKIGGCYFSCKKWENRLYRYESDLPYTYNSRLLYGEGGCIYLLSQFSILRNLHIYAKGDIIAYTTPRKDSQSRVRAAVKYTF